MRYKVNWSFGKFDDGIGDFYNPLRPDENIKIILDDRQQEYNFKHNLWSTRAQVEEWATIKATSGCILLGCTLYWIIWNKYGRQRAR